MARVEGEDPVLRVTGVSKFYGRTTAVADLNLELWRGQSLGLLGPNGAGKTTTLKMLATLLKPDSGTIEILGHSTEDPYRVRPSIGFMPDVLGIYPEMHVTDYLEFFCRAYAIRPGDLRSRIESVATFVGLRDLLDQPLAGMSRGMLQRVALARALVHQPPLLLLDEPAAGLDPRSRVQFRRLLQELLREGKTVVISSHVLSDLEDVCSHITVMEEGSLLCSETIEQFLKHGLGPRTVHLRVSSDAEAALAALRSFPGIAGTRPVEEEKLLACELPRETGAVAALLRHLLDAGVEVESCAEPALSLEQAYLQRTRPEPSA
ncbi:MAG: ABC transporter ATP-binding protein [Candidatus Eremiobacterota bacterium]